MERVEREQGGGDIVFVYVSWVEHGTVAVMSWKVWIESPYYHGGVSHYLVILGWGMWTLTLKVLFFRN